MPDSDNILWVGNTGFEASADHLVILQDEYKSGYECPRCGDKEHRFKLGSSSESESIIDCENCMSVGSYASRSGGSVRIKCSPCAGTGKIPCPDCGGKGSKTIVIPDDNKGRPTTGVVMSVGENVVGYKVGNRLNYPSTAGHAFDIAGADETGKVTQATIVILIERDILCRVHGALEAKNVKKSMALHTLA